MAATSPKGKLLTQTSKGSNHWVNKKDISKYNLLPNIPHLIKIANSKSFNWIEADRFKDQEMSIKIIKDLFL